MSLRKSQIKLPNLAHCERAIGSVGSMGYHYSSSIAIHHTSENSEERRSGRLVSRPCAINGLINDFIQNIAPVHCICFSNRLRNEMKELLLSDFCSRSKIEFTPKRVISRQCLSHPLSFPLTLFISRILFPLTLSTPRAPSSVSQRYAEAIHSVCRCLKGYVTVKSSHDNSPQSDGRVLAF